ncbi:MAG: HD domain-containing protein, partial [Variovorax sp.]
MIAAIEDLFERHGDSLYEGERQEAVTPLEHALQCAQLAGWAHAAPPLVAAALLHDLGHLLASSEPRITGGADDTDDADDAHELRALPFLARAFGSAVTEPVRLHVAAKRYLVRVDEKYTLQLSPAS